MAAGYGGEAHIGLSVRHAIAHPDTWGLLFMIGQGDVHPRAVWLALRVVPDGANGKGKSTADRKIDSRKNIQNSRLVFLKAAFGGHALDPLTACLGLPQIIHGPKPARPGRVTSSVLPRLNSCMML